MHKQIDARVLVGISSQTIPEDRITSNYQRQTDENNKKKLAKFITSLIKFLFQTFFLYIATCVYARIEQNKKKKLWRSQRNSLK